MGGDRAGPAVECGIVPICLSVVATNFTALSHCRPVLGRRQCGRGRRSAVAVAAYVLQAGRGVDEGGDVGVPPPGGRGSDEHPPKGCRGVAVGGILAQCGRAHGRELTTRAGQEQPGVVVEWQGLVGVNRMGGLGVVDEACEALREGANLLHGARGFVSVRSSPLRTVE